MIHRSLILAFVLLMALVAPAQAHKLKIFATVEGQDVTGYAFFIGGGRAQGTDWDAKNPKGEVLARGKTGTEGEFHFTPPQPIGSDIVVTVNTQEGHIATTTLKAERFGSIDAAAPETNQSAPPPAITDQNASATERSSTSSTADIEAAVQHQIEPLLERIEEMDARMRFTDIMSGIFLIIGLAGIGLWAKGRKV